MFARLSDYLLTPPSYFVMLKHILRLFLCNNSFYRSVVHYVPGLTPKGDNYIGGRRWALGLDMSELDVLRVQRYYSCQENDTEYKNSFEDRILIDCSFDNGSRCDMIQVNIAAYPIAV